MDKALQLNGKKLMGLEIKLEKAKSKESLKENKKGMACNSEYLCTSKNGCNRSLEWACGITDGWCAALEAHLPGLSSVTTRFSNAEMDMQGGMGRKDGYARGNGSVVSFRTHGFWADQVEVTFFLFAERDARTLFVKNLPYRLTEEEMKNVFENAVEVRIVLNKEGSSKGYVSKGTLDICRFLDSSCILKS